MTKYILSDVYTKVRTRLAEAGVDTPHLDARLLIKHVFSVSDSDIIAGHGIELLPEIMAQLEALTERRVQGEPISRILAQREFWSLPFKVTKDVLDPRPDTETLVEVVLKSYRGSYPEQILDLGTGSGCILLSLLHEWPEAQGIGVDISMAALRVAEDNAVQLHLEQRAGFACSDWGQGVRTKFDLVVSNPPYIPDADIANLSPEVKNHDPLLALKGGQDGLKCYRSIIMELKSLLNPGGKAFLEIGYQQAADIQRIVEDTGLSLKHVHPDIAGIPRVVEISLGKT